MEIICFHNPDEENGYLSNWFHSDFSIDEIEKEANEAVYKNFAVNIFYPTPEELEKLRTKIFDAIEEACREETEKWGKDEITWDKNLISQVPGGTQDSHTPLVESAWLGLKSLDIEPVFHRGGCTNANVAVSKGIPSICLGRAFAPDENRKNIMNHSVHEKFPITDSYKAVQQAFMVLMMAAGIDGETNSVVEGK